MRARTTLLVTALTLAASGAGASVATATPGPTPDEGLTGACNMTNTHAAFGMFTIAGSRANANGFDGGMITAILNTNGGTVPDNCQGWQNARSATAEIVADGSAAPRDFAGEAWYRCVPSHSIYLRGEASCWGTETLSDGRLFEREDYRIAGDPGTSPVPSNATEPDEEGKPRQARP